jgi:hypothetical protein
VDEELLFEKTMCKTIQKNGAQFKIAQNFMLLLHFIQKLSPLSTISIYIFHITQKKLLPTEYSAIFHCPPNLKSRKINNPISEITRFLTKTSIIIGNFFSQLQLLILKAELFRRGCVSEDENCYDLFVQIALCPTIPDLCLKVLWTKNILAKVSSCNVAFKAKVRKKV